MDNLTCPKCSAGPFRTPAILDFHVSRVCKGRRESLPEVLPPVEALVPSKDGRRLFTPAVDPHYVVPEGIIGKMARLSKQAKDKPCNVLLLGPQGSGKTSLALQYAAINKRSTCMVPCVTMQEPQEWWGTRHFSPEKGDYYTPSLFVEAVETPDAVVILDDMNRVENPKVLNPLFPLLDDRRQSWVEEVDRFLTVAKGVIFFATVNEGWEFQGTDPLCRALKDRFYQVTLDYPPPDHLASIISKKTGLDRHDSRSLVELVIKLRGNQKQPIEVSTRQVLLAAEDMVHGASIREAIKYTFLASLPDDAKESVLITLQQVVESTEEVQAEQWSSWP